MIKVDKRRWHRLDNTANLFPVITNKRKQNIFRMTAVLKQDINSEVLQKAVNETLLQFPAFNVRLKNGLFWSYFETTKLSGLVFEEKYIPFRFIDTRSRKNGLFRVLYYKNRIHLEVFHALSDGTGALRFLKAICYRYLQLNNAQLFTQDELSTRYGLEGSFNTQDGYMKNYAKTKTRTFKEEKAFRITGEHLPNEDFNIFTAIISVDQIKALSKKLNCTITEYLSARISYGIYCDCMGKLANNRPISVFVAVNLRKIFGTDTSLNFFSNISSKIKANKAGLDFNYFLEETKKEFKEKNTKEYMQEKLSYTAGGQNNIFIRFTPLFVKKIILKFIYKYSVSSNTLPFSNVGVLDVETDFENMFDSFRFLLAPSKNEPVTCGVVTYQDKMCFTLVSMLESTLLSQAILRGIANDGIKIVLESNGGRDEVL